jgi:hypothetical protein
VLDPGAELDEVLRALIADHRRVRACDRLEPDLEEAFSRILRGGGESA